MCFVVQRSSQPDASRCHAVAAADGGRISSQALVPSVLPLRSESVGCVSCHALPPRALPLPLSSCAALLHAAQRTLYAALPPSPIPAHTHPPFYAPPSLSQLRMAGLAALQVRECMRAHLQALEREREQTGSIPSRGDGGDLPAVQGTGSVGDVGSQAVKPSDGRAPASARSAPLPASSQADAEEQTDGAAAPVPVSAADARGGAPASPSSSSPISSSPLPSNVPNSRSGLSASGQRAKLCVCVCVCVCVCERMCVRECV